jgi:hypothetical protein
MLLLIFTSYSYAQQIVLPQDTNVVLALTKYRKIFVLDNEGKEIPSCQLCTVEFKKRFGAKCDGAEKENIRICRSLTGGIVEGVNSAVMLESRSSPGCQTIWIGGNSVKNVGSRDRQETCRSTGSSRCLAPLPSALSPAPGQGTT